MDENIDEILHQIIASDNNELPELNQSDLQILQDIQKREEKTLHGLSDSNEPCSTPLLSKDVLSPLRQKSDVAGEGCTWGSMSGALSGATGGATLSRTENDVGPVAVVEGSMKRSLSESSLQSVFSTLSHGSEDTESTKSSEGGQMPSKKAPVAKKKKVMLDDFLWQLLQDDQYVSYIQWTLKERLEFKFSRPEMVAKLWGDFKNRKRMTYEKLSRGLRYYYHSKKLERIQHKHYHFRFLQRSLDET